MSEILKKKPLYDIDEILGQKAAPPRRGKLFWPGLFSGLALAVILAGGYHFGGASRFCGACHSMENEYSQWKLSRHKQFTCTECHMPDVNIAGKLVYKARAGLNDLWYEVIRDYPANIRLSSKGKDIMNENCFRCHFSTIENTGMSRGSQNCMKCHNKLVHGTGMLIKGVQHE